DGHFGTPAHSSFHLRLLKMSQRRGARRIRRAQAYSFSTPALSNVEGSSEAIQAQRRLWAFSAACYGKFVSPIRYRSHSRAAPLPSLIAQTTRLWPRRQSPAATTATVP